MTVLFIKETSKSYSIRIEPQTGLTLEMSPAPGYDDYLPHDVLHMIVEGVLQLPGGVFGQLSAGGDASSFRIASDSRMTVRELSRERRRLATRSDRLAREGASDSSLSENGTYLAWQQWLSRSDEPTLQRTAAEMSDTARSIRSRLTQSEQQRLDESMGEICRKLTQFSAHWRSITVGELVRVSWPDLHISGAT